MNLAGGRRLFAGARAASATLKSCDFLAIRRRLEKPKPEIEIRRRVFDDLTPSTAIISFRLYINKIDKKETRLWVGLKSLSLKSMEDRLRLNSGGQFESERDARPRGAGRKSDPIPRTIWIDSCSRHPEKPAHELS